MTKELIYLVLVFYYGKCKRFKFYNRIHNCRFIDGDNLKDLYRLNEEYQYCIEYTENIENPILRYLAERMLHHNPE